MEEIKKSLIQSKAYECMECGRCTGICPISRHHENYSPRIVITKAGHTDGQSLIDEDMMWYCLTCGACHDRCLADVDYTGFTMKARAGIYKKGESSPYAHGGILHSLMRYMAKDDIKQDRLSWVDKTMRIAKKGEVLYYVGCLPYYQVYFNYLQDESLEIARSVVKFLNHVGIEPMLLENERCCGHDLLCTGDFENYEKLAKLNLEMIRKSGAKKVVMACAECVRTFRIDYQENFGPLGFEVMHFAEFYDTEVDKDKIRFKKSDTRVTYHDACHLGRHLDVIEQPRSLMNSLPGVEILEMDKNRRDAICCGTSSWANCTRTSKQISSNRLRSANETGAELMITSCPKCAIHFKCAMSGDSKASDVIKIQDLAVLAASALDE